MMQCDWFLSGPLTWLRYVDKHVRVKAGKDEEHRGWLLTVDPVSASLVLVDFKEDKVSGRVVMGHAVRDVEILQEADPETVERLGCFYPPSATPNMDPEQLRKRRMGLYRWLERNRVPVDEDGDELRVAGVVTIMAPYRAEDCCCSNQIILDRIQRLIQDQPDQPDYDPGVNDRPPG